MKPLLFHQQEDLS